MRFRDVVTNWMRAYEQTRMNMKQLRRLWLAWRHEGFQA